MIHLLFRSKPFFVLVRKSSVQRYTVHMQDQHNVALLSIVALSSYWPSNPTVNSGKVKQNPWCVNLGDGLFEFLSKDIFFVFVVEFWS